MKLTPDELLAEMPPLAERVRCLNRNTDELQGKFVLYWMHHALRAHENPALEIAILTANRLQIPLLVYQGLSEQYRFASDRHHTFILQGARAVQADLRLRGIPYSFHLEREGHRGPWLRKLVERAAILVTEETPVDPILRWMNRLQRATRTPIWAVDSSCVVPMPLTGRALTRAFEFRRATRSLLPDRLTQSWTEYPLHPNGAREIDIPFAPLDLSRESIRDLVARCRIDHSVGPVAHTVGGSPSGYERWNRFRRDRLQSYARTRNDALCDGVSRMSAYLHYGMVSPFRLAREAAEVGGEGSEKFLDELLVWRELAWSFCLHHPDHETLNALPAWARETLEARTVDPRPALFDWETLARARTGESLWDAAQTSLLKYGELHNNLRMTWGKALLNWTPDPQSALAMLIDLNHRYALDGRDPASYGGILWCLGQFDRPFQPEQPILGCVRPRPIRIHAERLDPLRFMQHVDRPACSGNSRIAVVGAGIAGLMCARTLQDHGIDVTVFDKGRSPGGRMSTRQSRGGFEFDHGCQHFSADDERFRRYVLAWESAGLVERWRGRIVAFDRDAKVLHEVSDRERFVGTPGMSTICRHLAKDLTVNSQVEVDRLDRAVGGWNLIDLHGRNLGEFGSVVVAIPAAQAARLLKPVPRLAASAESIEMTSCWTVMSAFDSPLNVDWDAALIEHSPIGWAARNSSKPQRRGSGECWVLQATPEWSAANLEADRTTVAAALVDELLAITDSGARTTHYLEAHRWRYATPRSPVTNCELFDSELNVGVCGDWLLGDGVESAFLSGAASAGRILGQLQA